MNRPPPAVVDYMLLLSLSALFGSSFMFTNIALRELSPLTIVSGRLLVALAVFIPIMWFVKQRLPRGWVWILILACAFFGNALPFMLISWAQQTVDAGLTAIFMAIMPLATVALAHLFTPDEKLNALKFAGVIAGLLGVFVLMAPATVSFSGFLTLENVASTSNAGLTAATTERKFDQPWVRQLAVVAASLCYAINAILTRQLVQLPRYSMMSALMLLSLLLLLPVWSVTIASGTVPSLGASGSTIFVVLFLGLGPTALATMMIFTIIKRQGASFLSQINYLVPLFGVMFGAFFLAEKLPLTAWPALLIILAGVYLTRRGGKATAVEL